MIDSVKKALVVSAHADDETFGMGGTLLRLKASRCRITWVIMSRQREPRWSAQSIKKRNDDTDSVISAYGFDRVERWEFPDNRMDECVLDDYQARMIQILDEERPDSVFCPGNWDWNWEHELAFRVVEASVKPAYSTFLSRVVAYEIPSSTDWAFQAIRAFPRNLYVDISSAVEEKVRMCLLYSTETGKFPHSRSAEGIRHFAAMRGMESGLQAAEAFCLLRGIERAP